MTTTADTSGQRSVAARLRREIEQLERECRALEETTAALVAQAAREHLELNRTRRRARYALLALAGVGVLGLVALVLWTIGRLAVAIGGA